MQLNPDFVVIGAGIAGASAAYELSAHGKVVVLEAEAVAGYHTTGRSAALFTEAWERGPWRALASSSRPFLQAPPAGFVEHPILSSLPVLIIGRIDQSDAVQSLYETATAQVAVTLLDGDEASNWCPMLRPGYVHKALLEPGSHAIDVDGLHQGFQRGAKRRGGQIMLGHTVDRIERRGPGWLVVAGDVEVQTPVVVNAAGAWCDKVGAMAGLPPIGLVPKRRTAFTFAAPDGVDLGSLAMVIDIDEQFYFKPESGQLMGSLAEATPMEPHDVRPEEIDVALAIERIEAATVMEIRHVRRTWAGLRSFVADGSPVVGEDPLAPGFFWLAGQGGAGILTSPAMSQLVAGLVTTGAAPAALFDHGVDEQSLSPTRLCGRS
ncbi:MAG: FAD-binding oxidoreductase [bacterium]|nr:FAD-binding oxidoreductase [bacterium]